MAIRSIMFAMFVVASIALMGNLLDVSAQAECGADLQAILNTCRPFLTKDGPMLPPSEPCCGVLHNVNIPCLCGYITPPVEETISVEKAIFVARACGCTVPTGIKCGSYTVPPPSPPPSK